MLSILKNPYSRNANIIGYVNRKHFTFDASKYNGHIVNTHANDGTRKHVHIAKIHCNLTDCETKVCTSVCGTEVYRKIIGHQTHKAPAGRFARFISETDANGDLNVQYFVKTNKESIMSSQEIQTYSKNIKPNAKQQHFVEKHQNKYDE